MLLTDMTFINTLIQNVGFPIAMCLIMAYYIRELTNSHKEEMNEIVKSLNENTKILTELSERIRRIEDEETN